MFGNTQTNGNPRETFSSLAHPVSLTQEPNPFIIANENNNGIANAAPKPKLSLTSNSEVSPSAPATEPVKPILEVNDVICIPRATLKTPPVQSNVQKFENKAFRPNSHLSALAQRTSYMEYERERERDPSKIPKRTNSYNMAQVSGQRPRNHNTYDNKAFDYRSEREIYKPVLIKRASTKRNQRME